jgi:CheY-like chemotaxis protein/HPt (histidine-containing phosphotransfer) domain-containing protein
MLTALVIDESPAARRQVTGLLELAGWRVHEAADAEDARWLNTIDVVDLVATAATVPGAASGAALLTELRSAGCTARFVVVTPRPTPEQRAAAAGAGALACLAAPVDASLLLDLVRRTASSPPEHLVDVEDLHDVDLDADLMDRLHGMYEQALPTRFSAIHRGVQDGDPRAVAAAAHTLAGTSGQLGHPEVASVCQAIASDARRGVLAHTLVSRLAGLTGVDRRSTDRRRADRRSAACGGDDRRVADRRSPRS